MYASFAISFSVRHRSYLTMLHVAWRILANETHLGVISPSRPRRFFYKGTLRQRFWGRLVIGEFTSKLNSNILPLNS